MPSPVIRDAGRTRRGFAVVLVLVVMGTLFLAGIVAAGLRTTQLRSAAAALGARRAYYCAESGLSAGRDFFRQNVAGWSGYLASGFVYTGTAGGLTYAVSIRDNQDEFPPQANDPLQDRDYTVLLESTCTDPGATAQLVLRQHLTLNPLANEPSGLPVRVGPVTYATTSDFTAGAGTDASGAIATPGPSVSGTAVDLRGDRVILQVGQMLGTWTVRQYCGESCNGWRGASWVAAAPPGTLVTVRARSAPQVAGLVAAPWVPLMSGVAAPQLGDGSLRGRFIEVQVTLQTAVAGLSPLVDEVTVTPH